MNCPTTDKLSQYVDNLLPEQELNQMNTHINSCNDCKQLVEIFLKEQRFVKETLQTPTLPDDFASLVLNQLEPYKPNVFPKKRKRWKRLMFAAAGIVLAFGLSTTLSPSFAQWIGGLFSTEQVDEGLRMATEAGLAKRVNREVTDQGVTLKVEDVVADSSRVALSYQILNKDGNAQDTYLDFPDSGNQINAINQNGEILDGLGMGWSEGSDYGLIEFSLREYDGLEQITIKFDLVEVSGIKGNWELDIPVDLTENRKLTTTLPLNDANTSSHGVGINMKEVRFAPSSNELLYETSYTKEEKARVEEEIAKLEEKFGLESVQSFTNYSTAVQYHIENEETKAIYHHNAFLKGKGHPSDFGLLQGSGMDMDQLGQVTWNESFIPQKVEQKLTFVLDGMIKTVPADFSIKIKPKELKKNPVSFEYEGNFITIKKAKKSSEYSLRKSLIPIQRETIFKIEMEGGKKAPSSDLGAWVLVDDKGKAYFTFHSGSILDEKDENGHYKTTIDLRSYDLDEVPEELTLHLLSVTRYDEFAKQWQVPLYEVD